MYILMVLRPVYGWMRADSGDMLDMLACARVMYMNRPHGHDGRFASKIVFEK